MSNDKITGEQVKAGVMKLGVSYIPHHDCSICGVEVGYVILGGDLFFDSGCGCLRGNNIRPASWDEPADWINMQFSPDVRKMLMDRFGVSND
jgi:hypothetical protein